MNALKLLIPILLLSGCVQNKPVKVDIQTIEVPRVELSLPEVDKLRMGEVEWTVLNEDNALEEIEALLGKNYTPTFMCVPDEGYEALGLNFARVRQLVEQQQAVIGAYKRYYTEQDEIVDRFNADQRLDAEAARQKAETAEPPSNWFLRWIRKTPDT